MEHNWIFDFDGTLFDTREDIRGAWLATIAAVGRTCPEFDQRYVTGPTLEETAKILFPDDWDDALLKAIRENYGRIYDASGFPTTHPYPEAEALIRQLSAAGARIFVATNKRMVPTRMLLGHWTYGSRVTAVYTSDMELPTAGHLITKVEMLSRAMAEYGIARDDAVMVGDMTSDIRAGKAVGIKTIGVTWGYGTRDELTAAGADELLEANP